MRRAGPSHAELRVGDSPLERSKARMRGGVEPVLIVGLCALLGVGACRHHGPEAQRAAEPDPPPLPISRDAHLAAIDVSLGRRGTAERVWINGAGGVWLTPSDMRVRRAGRGDGYRRKCPGEPHLWIELPVVHSSRRVDLHVGESGRGAQTLARVFEFVCADGRCQTRGEYDTNELIATTCGPIMDVFGERPQRHPLTQSVQ